MKKIIVTILVCALAYLSLPYIDLFFNWKYTAYEPEQRPCTDHPACFFNENYDDARSMFRKNVLDIGWTLHSLPVPIDKDNRYYEQVTDLTIDIAVSPGGSKEHVVIHMSGTHGVEAHTGSAIQNAILTEIKDNPTHNGLSILDPRPTVIMVHVFNPYGFKIGRRFNENNVDLNRNCLLNQSDWDDVLSRDIEYAGYSAFSGVMNPKEPYSWYEPITFISKAIYYIMKYGFSNLQMAVVTGQYHTEKGLQYGGKTMQTSHKVFHDWLEKEGFLKETKHVLAIDVHTGLGPQGRDTLLNDGWMNEELVSELFPDSFIETMTDSESVTKFDTYRMTKGMNSYFMSLFTNVNKPVLLTEEFGTVPSILVFYGLRGENAAYQYGDDYDHKLASDYCRSTFYVRNEYFKNEVVVRGKNVFYQSLRGVFHDLL